MVTRDLSQSIASRAIGKEWPELTVMASFSCTGSLCCCSLWSPSCGSHWYRLAREDSSLFTSSRSAPTCSPPWQWCLYWVASGKEQMKR